MSYSHDIMNLFDICNVFHIILVNLHFEVITENKPQRLMKNYRSL